MNKGILFKFNGVIVGVLSENVFYCNRLISIYKKSHSINEQAEVKVSIGELQNFDYYLCGKILGIHKQQLAYFDGTNAFVTKPTAEPFSFKFGPFMYGESRKILSEKVNKRDVFTSERGPFFFPRMDQMIVEKLVRAIFNPNMEQLPIVPEPEVTVFGVDDNMLGFKFWNKIFLNNRPRMLGSKQRETHLISYPDYNLCHAIFGKTARSFTYEELNLRNLSQFPDPPKKVGKQLLLCVGSINRAIAHFDEEKRIVSFPEIWQEKRTLKLRSAFNLTVFLEGGPAKIELTPTEVKNQFWLVKALHEMKEEKIDPHGSHCLDEPVRFDGISARIFSPIKAPKYYSRSESLLNLRSDLSMTNIEGCDLSEIFCISLIEEEKLRELISHEFMCSDTFAIMTSFLYDMTYHEFFEVSEFICNEIAKYKRVARELSFWKNLEKFIPISSSSEKKIRETFSRFTIDSYKKICDNLWRFLYLRKSA
jgi:hypothetical protein